MSDELAHFLRITGYGYGMVVSLVALKFWLQEYRRKVGIVLTIFSVIAYTAAFGYSVERFLVGPDVTPFFVTIMALLTIGYINPTLILVLMLFDVRENHRRRRAMELAEKLDIDPADLTKKDTSKKNWKKWTDT